MSNLINYQWRITKYNPAFRDEDGYYTLQKEWTCPSEIGKVIDGKEFTLVEYLGVETAYVNTVMTFLSEYGLSSLRILQLTKMDVSKEDKVSILYETEFDEMDLQEDKELNENEIRIICKMILRNFVSCQLYSKGAFFVDFGWDYYMYIGSSTKCPSSIKFANESGLFVEETKSPYYFSEEETTRTVQWNEQKDEHKLVVGEEEITDIHIDEFRKIFNLSKDHPVIGSFEITNKQAVFIQKFLNHKIDFSKYEYGFWGGN
ncbi:hypothetical protein [Psychrobacillus sp.]|uniref:DUF7683 domain-containing protein n=1 Tax=Psychrobacillus sp. TaxID=1871623 RepID=UPI0028BD4617|nr:hypothetical protein [Psychrobacillus sp.]